MRWLFDRSEWGVTAEDGCGRVIAGTKRPIIDDPILRSLKEDLCRGKGDAEGDTLLASIPVLEGWMLQKVERGRSRAWTFFDGP